MIKLGDYIKFTNDTNKIRRIITGATGFTAIVTTFERPSKGYARHLRKLKIKPMMKAEVSQITLVK